MALVNPNIAMGFRQPEFQVPNALAQYAQIQQIQGGQQAQELNMLKMQEAQAAMQERNALRQLNPAAEDYENQLFKVSPQLGIQYRKEQSAAEASAAAAGASRAAAAKSGFDLKSAQRKFGEDLKRSLSSNPSDENIIAFGQDAVLQGLYTPDQVQATVQQLLALPAPERVRILSQAGASAGELKPTTNVGPTGIVQTPAFGGTATVVPGTDAAFQMTPYQIAQNKIAQSQLGVSQGQLAVSQGQLKVAQDRLTKEGANLDPAENAAISKAIIEGRLDPNRVNGRNARILATTLMSNPEANLLELGVSASGATAVERSLATQTAKMSTAANEASKMVDIVRTYSDKVDRTEFPTINSITNAVSKGTGGKEIVQLNTSINALVNSYARAISPTGQPTVSDKNHAREVINSAYSTGQIGAILDVMQQEMSIAREAAGTASTELKAARETARGRGAETQASKNPHANKTDAQIKKELGLPP